MHFPFFLFLPLLNLFISVFRGCFKLLVHIISRVNKSISSKNTHSSHDPHHHIMPRIISKWKYRSLCRKVWHIQGIYGIECWCLYALRKKMQNNKTTKAEYGKKLYLNVEWCKCIWHATINVVCIAAFMTIFFLDISCNIQLWGEI